MVRRVYAQQKVLELYRNMKSIHYPIIPAKLLPLLPIPTRMMSYSEMAKASKCTVEDVAVVCNSEAGATHYDAANDRCLILYNDAMPDGRILWTQCHEIGHICMGHLLLLSNPQIADTSGRAGNELEQEAIISATRSSFAGASSESYFAMVFGAAEIRSSSVICWMSFIILSFRLLPVEEK